MNQIHPYKQLLASTIQCCAFDYLAENYAKELNSFQEYVLANKRIIQQYSTYANLLITQLNQFEFCLSGNFSFIRERIAVLLTLDMVLNQIENDCTKLRKYSRLNDADKANSDGVNFVTFIRQNVRFDNISEFHNRALQQQNTITRILNSCVAVDLQISETWKEIQEQINTIKCYSNDRHSRANVIKTYQEIADLWPNRYSGAYSIASKMEQLQTQINRLEHSYDIENQELLTLHNRLANMTYELWSEDKEKYEMLISDFISRGNRKCSFDIAQIKTNIQKDIATKEKTLAQTVDKYRWLKKEPYRVSYNELISYTVSQSYYLAQIEELRKERRRRIWGTIGSISWGTIKVIAKIVGFAVIAVGAIISLIFAITSKDDDK